MKFNPLILARISLLIGLIVDFPAGAQSLQPSVYPTAGGYGSRGLYSLSWTMGEPLHTTLEAGNYMLTQGEQQPYLDISILTVKAFIQGFYRGSGLMTAVSDLSAQPTTCDTIILRLVDPEKPTLTYHQDKWVITTDGSANFWLMGVEEGSKFYLVLDHRNSLETWSAQPVTMVNDIEYDFSTAATQAYGNNLFDLGDGRFALWSGDVNKDGFINQNDLDLEETALTQFFAGYHIFDLTGDRITESSDYSLLENNANLNLFRQRP